MKRELVITFVGIAAAALFAVGYYSGLHSLPPGSALPGGAVASPATGAPAVAVAPAASPSTQEASSPSASSSSGRTQQRSAPSRSEAAASAHAAPAAPSRPKPASASASSSSASSSKPAPTPPPADTVWRVIIDDDDATLGPKTAPATVVLFTNFGCDQCKELAKAPTELRKRFGKKVRIVFKHKLWPEQPYGYEASMAALAAQAQGKFWKMYDKLFDNAPALDKQSLEQYAKEIGLDMARFRKDMKEERYRGHILRNAIEAYEVGAHSNPNVLVNGVRLVDKTMEGLMDLVKEQIKVGEARIKKGTPPDKVYDEIIKHGKWFPMLDQRTVRVNTVGSPAKGPAAGKAQIEVAMFEDFQ